MVDICGYEDRDKKLLVVGLLGLFIVDEHVQLLLLLFNV